MIFIIGLAVLGGLIAAAAEEDPLAFIVGAPFGAIFGCIVALIVGACVYNGTHMVETRHTALVNMNDGAGVEGHFFLGSGTVDSVPSFTWYESSGNNSYVRRDADAGESTVHYLTPGSGERPYYTLHEEKPVDKGTLKTWGFNTEDGWDEHYDFYVPKGSITREYVLDNK